MHWYVRVQHFTCWYVPVYNDMNQTGIIITWYISVHTVSKSGWVFTLGALILGRYMEAYTFHVHHNTSWCYKCNIIHFLASSERKMYIHVHAGIYCHVRINKKVTTTFQCFHFESGLIRLATPTSFQSTLEPVIACSILPLRNILHPGGACGLPRPNCHSQGLTS
jgi:hypothetical protein